MSLRGKDFRGEIDPDLHDKLRKLADFKKVEVSSLGSELLEKMIVAEWHAFTVILERMQSSGILRADADSSGRLRVDPKLGGGK